MPARSERSRPDLLVHESEAGHIRGCRNGARALRVEGWLYAWLYRSPSAHAEADMVLLKRIKTMHASSRQTYGAPRVHAELRNHGRAHGRKRIARLMRDAGLTTTRRAKDAKPAPDLLDRNFSATAPN